MGELILYLLSLGFIWGAWGFKVMLIIFLVQLFLAFISKPSYSWDIHWGALLARTGVIITGIFAIADIYKDNTITAIAVAVTIILFVMDFNRRR